jgi:hypothetical protein
MYATSITSTFAYTDLVAASWQYVSVLELILRSVMACFVLQLFVIHAAQL